jgi:hypothetical protein
MFGLLIADAPSYMKKPTTFGPKLSLSIRPCPWLHKPGKTSVQSRGPQLLRLHSRQPDNDVNPPCYHFYSDNLEQMFQNFRWTIDRWQIIHWYPISCSDEQRSGGDGVCGLTWGPQNVVQFRSHPCCPGLPRNGLAANLVSSQRDCAIIITEKNITSYSRSMWCLVV